MIDAYPLSWPAGWHRTQHPQRSRFDISQHRAQSAIVRELGLLGATNTIISTNLELRRDGLPYTKQSRLDDQGVAVYFDLNGLDQCIPCDKWVTIAENMQAIAKTVEALRGLERWGAKEMVNAAFRGFKALPESSTGAPRTARSWYEVLEVSQTASKERVRAAYRSMLMKYHPDHGGDVRNFHEVQRAWQESGF